MDAATQLALRNQLNDRHRRLERTIAEVGEAPDLVRLLRDVDTALKSMDNGLYGTCEVCQGQVDPEFLLDNPLIPYCLCDLPAEKQRLLEHDLGLASRIQWALLPQQDFAAGGWETHFLYAPAELISGDTCSLMTPAADPESLYFVIGDVSGKGVAASFVMAHLHALLRSLIDARLPVGQVLERANRYLIDNKISSHYATMICGRAGRDGQVELSNAGHPTALAVRREGVEEVPGSGLPIGLFGGRTYTASQLSLDSGETLFLYTDGLTEARSPEGREYGTDRLRGTLAEHASARAGALVAAAMRDVVAHRAGSSSGDDLTILALRRAV
jgi:sigma-B regulation protein RsbU (phosphoserine phosphatase)